jgi:hypothetical protein
MKCRIEPWNYVDIAGVTTIPAEVYSGNFIVRAYRYSMQIELLSKR